MNATPDQARVQELRQLLGDCIGALRTAQPHVAMQPVRLALEAMAVHAEQALTRPEVEG